MFFARSFSLTLLTSLAHSLSLSLFRARTHSLMPGTFGVRACALPKDFMLAHFPLCPPCLCANVLRNWVSCT